MNEDLAMFTTKLALYDGIKLAVQNEEDCNELYFQHEQFGGQVLLQSDGNARIKLSGDEVARQNFKDYMDLGTGGVEVSIQDTAVNKMLYNLILALSELTHRFVVRKDDEEWVILFEKGEDLAGTINFGKTKAVMINVCGDKEKCEMFKIDLKGMLEVKGTHPTDKGERWDAIV